MPTTDKGEQPTKTPTRYYWKQCYEVGDSVHWALCDTASDAERPHRVSSAYMVLLADYPTAIGGQPVSEEPMLIRIVNALNNDATLERLNGELSVKLVQAAADRDREAAKVDKLDDDLATLRRQSAALQERTKALEDALKSTTERLKWAIQHGYVTNEIGWWDGNLNQNSELLRSTATT